MSMIPFPRMFHPGVLILLGLAAVPIRAAEARKPNILFITVDDMSCDSIGAFGCKLPGTSPQVDRLAGQGLKFSYAHVQVGNCMPSRNVMFSGRYPHNNKVEGFYEVPEPEYPVLADLFKGGGYFTAIRHKVSHSTPYNPYPAWDLVLDDLPDGEGEKASPKNIRSYRASTRRGIEAAKQAGKPFCLILNVADPHKPFYAEGKGGATVPDPNVPSRVFTADEVPVPGFLPDDPVVRKELAHYYSSVRRADDCVGAILEALKESGAEEETAVVFLSDHGMPLPFVKTQLYHHSTHTPLIVRWPGVTGRGVTDERHMVAAVDLLPTLLDIAGLDHPSGLDGRSFAPLLKGESQSGRDLVFKEYNENSGGNRSPMRAVQTKTHLYVFNPWSNGKRVMRTATSGTSTFRRMKELARTDARVAERVDLIEHRVLEEAFDVVHDPDALRNLIDDPGSKAEVDRLRLALEAWMKATGDPMLEVFRKRHDPAVRDAFMRQMEAEAEARGKPRAAAVARKAAARPGGLRKSDRLIALTLPATATAGREVTVKVAHHLPASSGPERLHVTLKAGLDDHRLDRKVLQVSGEGVAEVTFTLPRDVPAQRIRFAAFIGENFPASLQHINSAPIIVKPTEPTIIDSVK